MRSTTREYCATIARLAGSAALMALLLTAQVGCSKTPTRWDNAAEAAKTASDMPKAAVAEGATLNKFFPAKEFDGKTLTYTSEKPGAVEAKFEDKSGDLGTFAITDVAANPTTMTKYDSATEKVGEFPLVTQGNNKSAVLVGKRFQVSIMSTKLDAAARKPLFDKFDLRGLAAFTPPAAK
jgi:hypothetical protein